MITDERIDVFLNSLDKGNSGFLAEVEAEALRTEVPIIRKDMQRFMKCILQLKNPKRILEVGTAVGFSALLMAQNTEKHCMIDTIEKYEKRIPIARGNFEKSGYAERIRLLEGDALEILKTLDGQYDFIFMDAAKAQYIVMYPEIKRLLKSGGVLLSDNVLQEGDILESKYAVRRRDRTIHKRMREYLYTLQNDEDFTTSIMNVGDGVAMSIRR